MVNARSRTPVWNKRSLTGLLALAALAGCDGGQKGDPDNRGPFELTLISTGASQVYPYRIAKVDGFGNPSTEIINIAAEDDLKDNVTNNNGVLPVGTLPVNAELPNGSPGNHFLMFKFSHDLRVESILSDLPANQSNSGLTNNIQLLRYDPTTEQQQVVTGRGFVGGYTYYDDPLTPALDLQLVQAVTADDNGDIVVLDSRATGFPAGFNGDEELVSSKTFVFIPDTDQDLTSFETFPSSEVIRLIISSSVLDYRDKPLSQEAVSATTVGPDTINPNILGSVNTSRPLQISPGGGQLAVDPTTSIRISFSKPVQPYSVGEWFSTSNKTPAFRGVTLNATITSQTIPILYYADPFNPGDLCNYEVVPAYLLPSSSLHSVQVETSIDSLVTGVKVGTIANTTFTTGTGPGLVNAPISPEAIYIGRAGSNTGISVLDLNGNGQGTGSIDLFNNVKYQFGLKRNPNLKNSGVIPPIAPGTQNLDAGSSGALTLTLDTNLSDLLIDSSIVASIDDIEIGQPLDIIYNNENVNIHVTRGNQANPLTGAKIVGNCITQAPIPNPPKLTYAGAFTNPAYNIFAEEPSVSNTVPVPPCTASSLNLLVQGNPLSQSDANYGQFFVLTAQAFVGPQPRPASPGGGIALPCAYQSRQQIGHFLYVLDRLNGQVLALNSNRMQVVEIFKIRGVYSMAISPNLKRLAVTNSSANTVLFIDTDPLSNTFHQIVAETKVGNGPTELAWQPEGEDLLVIDSRGNSLSIISGPDLVLRKTVISKINSPVDICVTARQSGIGWGSGIYFAYILNGDGSIAVFESGPDGPNGIGFDDVVGLPEEAKFKGATVIQPDIVSFNSAIWIAHKDATGLGQISHLELTSSPTGALPITQINGGIIQPPTFRQRVWSVTGRIGGSSPTTPIKDLLSGKDVVDIAIDELQNFGGFAPFTSVQVSNILYAQHSGKGHVKVTPPGTLIPAITPRFLFAGLSDQGSVDVLELDTGRRLLTVPCSGVKVLTSYWKQ